MTDPRLKLILLRHYSDGGFALPLAVGLGLSMILIGMTLIARSSDDQVNSLVQNSTTKSLGIAEASLSRISSILNQGNNRLFLSLNYDPLNTNITPNKNFLGPNGIPNSGDEQVFSYRLVSKIHLEI
jgi:hypothetical protein